MIDIKQFEFIKGKYGGYASWAVWAAIGESPKSNMGDISIFDLDSNPGLLEVLNNNIIMVGLNISRSFSEPFRNFHDANPRANDFKIRYAFQNTEYYGAYMTDIIKNFEMINSTDVLVLLKERLDGIASVRGVLPGAVVQIFHGAKLVCAGNGSVI